MCNNSHRRQLCHAGPWGGCTRGNRVNHKGLWVAGFVLSKGWVAPWFQRLLWIILWASKELKDKQKLHLVCLIGWVVCLGDLICRSRVGTFGLGHLRTSQFYQMSRQPIIWKLYSRPCTTPILKNGLKVKGKTREMVARRWSRSCRWIRQPEIKECQPAPPEGRIPFFAKYFALFRRFFLISSVLKNWQGWSFWEEPQGQYFRAFELMKMMDIGRLPSWSPFNTYQWVLIVWFLSTHKNQALLMGKTHYLFGSGPCFVQREYTRCSNYR